MTRLPPLTPPPPANFAAVNAPAMPAPFTGYAAGAGTPEMVPRYRSEVPQMMPPRPSWLQALLASTFPSPTVAPDPNVTLRARRVIAMLCIVVAIALAVVALLTGLRGTADDVGQAASVMAALVLARAILAVGAGAVSFGFLRMAERLLGS